MTLLPILRRRVACLYAVGLLLATPAMANPDSARITSGAPTTSIVVAGKTVTRSWRLAPEANPDVYKVRLPEGVTQKVSFVTDVDTISFDVEAGKSYDFIISYQGKPCHTRIIGETYFAPTSLEISFNFDAARDIAAAVAAGDVDAAALEKIKKLPQSAAMIQKMRMKDFDAFAAYLRTMANDTEARKRAALVLAELDKQSGGKYQSLESEVMQKLKAYVPERFGARVHIHFIFGTGSGGFAFGGDDVYVNLDRYVNASALELAEIVEHEVFHGIQSYAKPRNSETELAQSDNAGTPPAKMWTRQLLSNLLEEGTAELFTHTIVDRPATEFSRKDKEKIERNARRIQGIMTMFETIVHRLETLPPRDGKEYDAVYGLMFYTDFDETAYQLGWTMVMAIEKKEGKTAVFELLKHEPKDFVLRYQALAKDDQTLPKFSDVFIETIRGL